MRNVELLEQFLFALSVKQRHFRAFDHRNVRAPSLLGGPKRKYCSWINPLIAAYRRDAKEIDLRSPQ